MTVASECSRLTLRDDTAYGCLRSQQMARGSHIASDTPHTFCLPHYRLLPSGHTLQVTPIQTKRGAHIKICPHLHRTTSIHNELLRFLSHVSETRCNRATMPTQFLTGKHRIVEWNSSLPPPNEICICARGLAKDPEEQVYKCWCVCLSLLHTTCLMCFEAGNLLLLK